MTPEESVKATFGPVVTHPVVIPAPNERSSEASMALPMKWHHKTCPKQTPFAFESGR